MEQVNVLFFLVFSFFTTTNNRIIADYTTVTVNTKDQEIKILQKDLSSFVQTHEDSISTLAQWQELKHQDTVVWASSLDEFEEKTFTLQKTTDKDSVSTYNAVITLTYSDPKSLSKLGIWYDDSLQRYSINNIPQHHITADKAVPENNYWSFNPDETGEFSFNLQPFLGLPEDLKKYQVSITRLDL